MSGGSLERGNLVIRPNARDLEIRDFLIAAKIDSVEDYLAWLRAHIAYESDGPDDVWTKPFDLIERGFGDCEDLALLSYAVLKVLGYEPQIMIVDQEKEGKHAITVFREGDHYSIMDNRKLIRTSSDSRESMFQKLVQRYAAMQITGVHPVTWKFFYLYSPREEA